MHCLAFFRIQPEKPVSTRNPGFKEATQCLTSLILMSLLPTIMNLFLTWNLAFLFSFLKQLERYTPAFSFAGCAQQMVGPSPPLSFRTLQRYQPRDCIMCIFFYQHYYIQAGVRRLAACAVNFQDVSAILGTCYAIFRRDGTLAYASKMRLTVSIVT